MKVYVNKLYKKFNIPSEINQNDLIEAPIDFADEEAKGKNKSEIYF